MRNSAIKCFQVLCSLFNAVRWGHLSLWKDVASHCRPNISYFRTFTLTGRVGTCIKNCTRKDMDKWVLSEGGVAFQIFFPQQHLRENTLSWFWQLQLMQYNWKFDLLTCFKVLAFVRLFSQIWINWKHFEKEGMFFQKFIYNFW